MRKILNKILITTILISSIPLFTSYLDRKKFNEFNLDSGINLTCFKKINFDFSSISVINKILYNGFSSIVLNPIYFQDDLKSSNIIQHSQFDNKHLEDLIDHAESKNLEIILKPMINTYSGESRTKINPKNIDEWFNDYSRILFDLLELKNIHKVKSLIAGCELDDLLIKEPERFNNLANNLKEKFHGDLGYSITFNSDEDLRKVRLLDKLNIDFIGIDFYVQMKNKDLADTLKFYEPLYYLNRITKYSAKPVIITELGYRSIKNSNMMFNYRIKDEIDANKQKQCYENFFKAIINKKNKKIKGIYFWITDNDNYIKDIFFNHSLIGYSIFDKPAENTLKEFNKKRFFFFDKN